MFFRRPTPPHTHTHAHTHPTPPFAAAAGAYTLEQAHILPAQTPQGGLQRHPASEDQLWSYLCQLTAALRCVHQAGLAAHPACLMPSKVRESAQLMPLESRAGAAVLAAARALSAAVACRAVGSAALLPSALTASLPCPAHAAALTCLPA